MQIEYGEDRIDIIPVTDMERAYLAHITGESIKPEVPTKCGTSFAYLQNGRLSIGNVLPKLSVTTPVE